MVGISAYPVKRLLYADDGDLDYFNDTIFVQYLCFEGSS
jgi:hypothetical protein